MMQNTSWRQWVIDQMARKGYETQSELARAAGIPQSAISQWLDPKKRQQPTVDNARKIAEAFGVPKLRGLVAAGLIPAEDLEEVGLKADSETNISSVSVAQLIVELNLRVQAMEAEIKALRKGEEPDHWSHGNDVPGLDFTDQHATRVHLVPSEKLQ